MPTIGGAAFELEPEDRRNRVLAPQPWVNMEIVAARTGHRLFGVEVAAALYPAPRPQWEEPESVLGRLEGMLPPPAPLSPGFDGTGIYNGPIYAMRRLRLRPRLVLDAFPAWYFDSVNTCERLEAEKRFENAFPPRRLWLCGTGRTAGIGISTVVAWREGGQWMALAGRLRPKGMPWRAGLLHVVPSGMFAPPWSVEANVGRELAEEAGIQLAPHALRLTGVAVNLRNLRPEICTLLVVEHPPAALAEQEFETAPLAVPLPAGRPRHSVPRCLPAAFIPPGAAALLLAARLLRSLESRRP